LPYEAYLRNRDPSALVGFVKRLRIRIFPASSFAIPWYCEACPGNTNATVPSVLSSSCAPALNTPRRPKLLSFFLVIAPRGAMSRGDRWRFSRRWPFETPLGDHQTAAQRPAQRGSAVRLVISVLRSAWKRLSKSSRHRRTSELFMDFRSKPESNASFANLQAHVAHEAITSR